MWRPTKTTCSGAGPGHTCTHRQDLHSDCSAHAYPNSFGREEQQPTPARSRWRGRVSCIRPMHSSSSNIYAKILIEHDQRPRQVRPTCGSCLKWPRPGMIIAATMKATIRSVESLTARPYFFTSPGSRGRAEFTAAARTDEHWRRRGTGYSLGAVWAPLKWTREVRSRVLNPVRMCCFIGSSDLACLDNRCALSSILWNTDHDSAAALEPQAANDIRCSQLEQDIKQLRHKRDRGAASRRSTSAAIRSWGKQAGKSKDVAAAFDSLE